MNKIIYFFIAIISIFPLAIFAEQVSTQNFLQEIKKDVGYRLNQPSIESRSDDTGLIENTLYAQDLSMMSLAILLNSDPMTIGDIFAIDVEYNAHWFDNKFINYFFYTGPHQFNAVSSVNSDLASSAAEVEATTNNITSLGMGISFTSHFLAPLFDIENLEEKISANFGYAFMTESVRDESYSGPGVKCDFGLLFRTSENYHYGIDFIWQHYGVSRDVNFDGEDISNRHLSLTWASIGVKLGVNF